MMVMMMRHPPALDRLERVVLAVSVPAPPPSTGSSSSSSSSNSSTTSWSRASQLSYQFSLSDSKDKLDSPPSFISTDSSSDHSDLKELENTYSYNTWMELIVCSMPCCLTSSLVYIYENLDPLSVLLDYIMKVGLIW